ncbi:hypothetical protein FGO68_gene14763 [Halteria grandinella]|uniref:Uncharacterized protein n=1 Tax=Halteria grandinella TaxID=5974 RepID=A0A8J8NS47_HALGN|nr:hypothetical protein FGO68_gene14763 [Halteria grandinella]
MKDQIRDQSDQLFIRNEGEGEPLIFGMFIYIQGLSESSSAYFRYSKNKCLDSGHTEYTLDSDEVVLTKNDYLQTITAVDYSEYKSLSSVFYKNIPDKRNRFFDTETIQAKKGKPGDLSINYIVFPKAYIYTRFPQSIFTALAKISGLLIVLKISLPFMAYHRKSFFKEMEKGKGKPTSNSNSIQNQINESLTASLFQVTKNGKMSIEDRLSFERIEETVEKVQDCSRQIQIVSDSIENLQQTTQKKFLSQGTQIVNILQQVPEQFLAIEQSVQNLQEALQRQKEHSIRQQEAANKQIENARKQQELQAKQISELLQANCELKQAILEIKQQAAEKANE